jgi:hypothetical protein
MYPQSEIAVSTEYSEISDRGYRTIPATAIGMNRFRVQLDVDKSSGNPMSAVSGTVRILLRLEGLSVLIAAALAYSRLGPGWRIFAIFFLAPDLSFLGYLAGPRVGAVAYNVAHAYIGAMTCLICGLVFSMPVLTAAGLIWTAHIGFDRALGYGLKYSTGFSFTHLGRIGRVTY